jgi:hypothetical protein
MRAGLAQVAAALGATIAHAIPWGALHYPHVAALRARLAERCAPASVNNVLSAVRGVARAAMRLGQLDARFERLLHQRRSFRARRAPDLSEGRAPAPGEHRIRRKDER